MLDHRTVVRDRYGKIGAERTESCCSGSACENGDAPATRASKSQRLGYSREELDSLPAEANLGLGCGNPLAIANLQPGESVLDLGSGGGIDCFLAAQQVGPRGRVIGVDMTPEMLARARGATQQNQASNVEFRLGEIEHLPLGDQTVDVILSNCVINLSPDKSQVFREAWRVLKPHGRLAIIDVLATAPMPESLQDDPDLLCACISGAATMEQTRRHLAGAGFTDISIEPRADSRAFIKDWIPGSGIESSIVSCAVTARRPTLSCS